MRVKKRTPELEAELVNPPFDTLASEPVERALSEPIEDWSLTVTLIDGARINRDLSCPERLARERAQEVASLGVGEEPQDGYLIIHPSHRVLLVQLRRVG